MKFYYSLIVSLFFVPLFLVGQATSIYDIQYTTNPGDGTYPSPLEGQYVTLGGIVSAYGYNDDNYFISSSAGGAWNGIFIYDDNYYPYVGDSIVLQGQVYEYNGLTEIKNVSSFNVVSSGNPLPLPAQLSTATVSEQEAYESVFVEVVDVAVSQTYDEYSEWRVDDGSGSCIISYKMFSLIQYGFPLFMDYPFAKVAGIVSYSYGEFRLYPRSINDLQSEVGAELLAIDDQIIYSQNVFDVPILISNINQSVDVSVYKLTIEYDPTLIEYNGYQLEGTVSQTGTIDDSSEPGMIVLNYSGNFSFSGTESLVNLLILPLSQGNTAINFVSAEFNSIPVNYLSSGNISINYGGESIGDTLTVIQRPIQNIPEIIVPGEEFVIICLAPENTNDWQAKLLYNDIVVPADIIESLYNSDKQRWYLKAVISQIELFELYDLKVTASGSISDVTKNAVHVIPTIKDDYYFVHITDTHLPTHYFWEEPQSDYDTSEMIDLREVVRDINLMRPEFVLLTGDFVNEGELEDFENRRNHTKAQRLLSEFEVPVYLVSGNHDLGGWDDTPPPQGTSRNEWWRFFGWQWLEPNSGELYYTQDYSFDYGPVHFVGLESYLNYDGYLFNIYGDESFIPTQLEWLDQDLLNASESQSNVLFYHKDFANQLNLSELDVDMALWGHIHSNSGSISTSPYDLATDAVCDNSCAYRVINVSNGNLTPNYTSYAGFQGDNLTIDFYPSNSGDVDSVAAEIENKQYLDFQNGIVKFVMPKGDYNYTVQNGTLQQVDTSGNVAICYVSVNIPSTSTQTVSITKESVASVANGYLQEDLVLYQNYPNPFTSETNIRFQLKANDFINLSIYDMQGNQIRTLINEKRNAGFHVVSWDGKNDRGDNMNGQIYNCSLSSIGGQTAIIRIVKL